MQLHLKDDDDHAKAPLIRPMSSAAGQARPRLGPRLWVPRTVPPPLISTFPKADLNITVPGRPTMIARCGLFDSPTWCSFAY